ncbi:MAG: hypothetical protein JSV13_07365 [Nitrospiraceae bacterium]|nr:MAG: hypothetical protein JSV13_07365 [Nitrospiraceae bacterium]
MIFKMDIVKRHKRKNYEIVKNEKLTETHFLHIVKKLLDTGLNIVSD